MRLFFVVMLFITIILAGCDVQAKEREYQFACGNPQGASFIVSIDKEAGEIHIKHSDDSTDVAKIIRADGNLIVAVLRDPVAGEQMMIAFNKQGQWALSPDGHNMFAVGKCSQLTTI